MGDRPAAREAPATRELIRVVLAVAEPAMRLLRLARALDALGDDAVIDTLEALQVLALAGDDRARAVLIDLGRLNHADSPLSPERVDSWRAQARERKSPVLAMLEDSRPRQLAFAPHAVDLNEHLEDMPLGRRKALARTLDRQALDRLVFDRHPAVVAILLNNPRLIERDVVRMAASRPTSVAALQTIARHPRWVRRYEVRAALSQNPYSPPALATRLLPTLSLPDLRRVASNLRLHGEVRSRARSLLGERGLEVSPPRQDDRPTLLINRIDDGSEEEGLDQAAAALAEAMGAASRRAASRRLAKAEAAGARSPGAEAPGRAFTEDTPPWQGPDLGSGDDAVEGEDLVDEDADALAADFLANLGPIRLVPVGMEEDDDEEDGEDGFPSPPLAEGSWNDGEEEPPARSAADVPAPETPPPAAAMTAAAHDPEGAALLDEDEPAEGAEVDAVASWFLKNLEIKLVPVGEDED